MDRMLYVAMTGAKQLMQAQALVANNLANVSTSGFRADLARFDAEAVQGPGYPSRINTVAAGVGFLTAFAFSYLPLQQAQSISPATLFRSKGLAAPPIKWRALVGSFEIVPLLVAAAAFFGLAVVMTEDPLLVAAFAVVSVLRRGCA